MMRKTGSRRQFISATAGAVTAGLVSPAVRADDPAAVSERLYWGDVHCHTNLSDGKGTLDEFLTYARDVARLDFVILTDHDFGNGRPTWNLPQSAWQSIQEKTDAYTVDGRFVAIAGYEWTSQAKYWTVVGPGVASERLFPGPPKLYNHKNVYFPGRVDMLFSSKDPLCHTPDQLAEAVRREGGLIHNNHPGGPESRDQFDYDASHYPVIANTEIGPDSLRYQGETYDLGWERNIQAFLGRGGQTGLVGGSDTHDLKPAARTAVLARSLTRPALFEALARRRNYAVSHARIVLDFKINGHAMGESIAIAGKPEISASVTGTAKLVEVAVIRDGAVLRRLTPDGSTVTLSFRDETFEQAGYYYLRATQADADEQGNPSYAWSSPIWVKSDSAGILER